VFLVSHCRVLRVYSSFLLVVLRIVYTALLFNPHDFPFFMSLDYGYLKPLLYLVDYYVFISSCCVALYRVHIDFTVN
jgi:hypothetical protein